MDAEEKGGRMRVQLRHRHAQQDGGKEICKGARVLRTIRQQTLRRG